MTKKSLVSLLAFVLVFVTVFALMGTTAQAAEINGVDFSKGTVDAANKKVTITATGGRFSSSTTTAKVKNNNDYDATVSFTYAFGGSGGSYDIAGKASGSAGISDAYLEFDLAAGSETTIKVTGNSGQVIGSGKTGTLTLTNVIVTLHKPIVVNLSVPQNGSYTVTSGSQSVTMTPTSSAQTFEYASKDGLTLKASPYDGYQFHEWTLDGSVLNGIQSTYFAREPSTDKVQEIGVKFIDDSIDMIYAVGKSRYPSWEEAMTVAVSGSNKVVTLMQDHVLPLKPSGSEVTGTYVTADSSTGSLTYTVPAGIKLLIPRSTSDEGAFSTSAPTDTASKNSSGQLIVATPYAFRTLTLESGVKMQVNGAVNVNAAVGTQGTVRQNNVSGPYGLIRLNDNSEIYMNSGSNLYCYGYIAGSGTVIANPGSYVYELIQLQDWCGGTNASLKWAIGGALSSNQFFVVSQYYVQNIEANYKVYSGANSRVVAWTHVSSAFAGPSSCDMVAQGNGLFKLANGYLTRKYDGATDRIVYNMYGDVATGYVEMGLGDVDVNSKNFIMPLTSNMEVNIMSGTTSVSTGFALLPDMRLYVGSDGKLDIASGAKVFNFDAKDWNISGYVFDGRNVAPIGYTVANGTSAVRSAPAKSAQIVVDGVLKANGNLYVTQNSNTSADKVLTGNGTFINNASGSGQKVKAFKNGFSGAELSAVPMVGKFADVDHANDSYSASATYAEFGKGTYHAVPGTDTWYQYKVTYRYLDSNGNEIVKEGYTPNNTWSLDAAALGTKRVITGYTVNSGSATVSGSPNGDVSNGWTNLNLASISSDVDITLTVADYDYTVSWTDKTGDTDVTRVDYISEGEPVSYQIDGLWDLSTINVTDASGAAYAVERSIVQTDEENAQSTTLTLTGIDRDIAVSFDGEAASLLVEWIVTGATEATKSQYVATGANVTYTLTQPEDGWLVVESCDVDNAVNAKESVTLNNVQANTTVNLNVVRYDCKVQLISGVDTITDPVAVEPFYMNFNSLGASVEIGVKDISSDTVRYIFDDIKSVSPAGTMYELSKYNDNLKINNLSNKLTTVLVNRRSFDYRVDIQEGNTTLDRQYIQGTAITPYNFANGVYVDSISAVTTANVALTQATATTNAALAVSDVSADTAVKVSTRNFDKVVTFVDASKADGETGRVLKEIFTTESSVTYTCDNRYRVEAATAANGAVSGVGGESITVSGLNGSTTVEVTLDHFDYKVYWKDQAQTNAQNYMAGVLETDYVDAGEAAVYQTADRQVATVFQKPNDVTLTPADGGEKLEATGVTADSEILLNLVDYSYKVTFNAKAGDVTKSITKYAALVDGQWKDVLDNGSIFYDATYNYDANTKYCITDYTLSNAAAAAVALTPENAVNGHTTLKITDLYADQTVDMNLAAVGHKVTWNIQTTTHDGATTTENFVEYLPVDATEARYTFPEGYCVTSVDGTATDRSSNVAVIENITGDVKVTVKAQDYSYKVTWKLTLNGETTTETVFLSAGTNSDTYELEDKFTITEISATNNAAVSGLETYTAKVENITADTTVSVTAKDYNYIVNWILYKDGKQTNAWTQYCDALAEMTWTQEDDSYVVTEVVASGALVNHTNKHVDVVSMSGSTATVTIKLETPLDGYTYFFGNMAYKYYKNSAEYTYQEGEGGWALRDTYTWTHVTGSKRHKEVDRDGNKVDYVVPNGSVLLVNNSNQIVKATVTVTSDQTWLTMYLSGSNKKGTVTENGDGTRTSVITFTLRPDDQIYVRGDLDGTPDEISEVAKAAGKWDVQFTPID